MIQNFYNKLSEKERKFFYVAVGFVVLAVFDALFLRPVLTRLTAITNEIRDRTRDIERDRKYLSYRDRIMQENRMAERYQADAAGMKEEDIKFNLTKTIERIASETEVDVVKLIPAEPAVGEDHILYKANLEATARLDSMLSFMYRVNLTDNLLRIDRVNLSGNKASAEEVRASMQVSKLVIDPETLGRPAADAGKDSGGSGSGKSGARSGGTGAPGGDASGSGPQGDTGAAAGGQGPPATGEGHGSSVEKVLNGTVEGRKAAAEPASNPGAGTLMAGEAGAGKGGGAKSSGEFTPGPKDTVESQAAARDDGQDTGEQGKINQEPEGERVRIKGFVDLWNDFWGIKPKKPDPQKGRQSLEDMEEEDLEARQNLWERMMKKE